MLSLRYLQVPIAGPANERLQIEIRPYRIVVRRRRVLSTSAYGGLSTSAYGGLSISAYGGLSSSVGGGLSTAAGDGYQSNIPPWPYFLREVEARACITDPTASSAVLVAGKFLWRAIARYATSAPGREAQRADGHSRCPPSNQLALEWDVNLASARRWPRRSIAASSHAPCMLGRGAVAPKPVARAAPTTAQRSSRIAHDRQEVRGSPAN